MAMVLKGSQDILPWLNEHHKLLWARSKFSADIKCDYINNNLKDLPLDSLADAIRIKTMVLFEKRRKISLALTSVILPAVIHQLNATSKGLDHLQVTKGNPKKLK